ncbi:MAG: hypothetical protein ABIP53_12015 [Candidatus Limnocylindrales bacterium]
MDDERLARLEQRLDELDQRSTSMERTMDRAMDKSRAAMNTIVPHDARKHMRAAWRENLLAVRSLIDFWANRMDERPEDESASNGRQNIPID